MNQEYPIGTLVYNISIGEIGVYLGTAQTVAGVNLYLVKYTNLGMERPITEHNFVAMKNNFDKIKIRKKS